MKKILIVEDEPAISELLDYNLKKMGYETVVVDTGFDCLKECTFFKPDAIILDVMLPGMSGYETLKLIRKSDNPSTPVLILTAKSAEADKLAGFRAGADDYLTKPFSVNELIARVEALLKRGQRTEVKTLSSGALKIDIDSHEATMDGRALELTPIEMKILKLFMENEGRVLSRETIIDKAWGSNTYIEPRTVDVHITRLREKIETKGKSFIKTVRGVGYKFKPENEVS